jgi:GTP cyclohydrolase II/3,4-dihydroxy 2-butanone 4-phosphate synthase/GTP cyclohydrolase II
VLRRRGHTEAGVDLCRLAGLEPAALICELVTPDRLGMLRGADAIAFAHRHGLPVVTIGALAERLGRVVRTGRATVPTDRAEFTAVSYRDPVAGVEHLALVLGDVSGGAPVLCRIHSECLTGDLVGSRRCDCGPQLYEALDEIAAAGRGVLVYLRGQEGRGIGLGAKLQAYRLQQEAGLDTFTSAGAVPGPPTPPRRTSPTSPRSATGWGHRIELTPVSA